MNKSEFPFLSISQLSKLLATKEVSPVEVTAAYLERIENLNGKLHAYVTITADKAIEAAQKAEQEIFQGKLKRCRLQFMLRINLEIQWRQMFW